MHGELSGILSDEDLATLRVMPAAYLAYRSLRSALEKASFLHRGNVGLLICVVPEGYRIQDYAVAAEYFFEKDPEVDWMNLDRSKRVYQTQEQSRKSPKGKAYEVTVFDLLEASFLITSDSGRVSREIRFAATEILNISPPNAQHINETREVIGFPPLADDVASNLAKRPQAFVIAGLFKREIDADHLARLDAEGVQVRTGPTLGELPGYSVLREWAKGCANDVSLWRDGKLEWAEVSRGALLSGPPGTGKTAFAQALASTLDFELVTATIGTWQAAGHLDDTLLAMRKSFSDAAAARGAVLLIDELDGIGHRAKLSGDHIQYWRVVINELLALTSRPIEGVIVLGATNYADAIDAAILRSGRIEEKFALSLPDFRLRAEILAYHLDFDIDLIDLADVVEELDGWSGADLELLAHKAKRKARTSKRAILVADIMAMLPERRRFSPTERYRLSVHEAGHAVVALSLGYCRSAKIVIKETFDPAKGANLGGTTSYEMEEDWLPTESALLTRIAVALAGLAAEALVLEDRSIGAGGALGTDVERATVIARRMVVSYGLGKIPMFLRKVEDVDCHTPMPADFEREVRVILAAQYGRVRTVLSQKIDVLIATANEAMVRGSLIVGEAGEPTQKGKSSAA